jgi:ABC-type microcin C transport system permease subunit YejE
MTSIAIIFWVKDRYFCMQIIKQEIQILVYSVSLFAQDLVADIWNNDKRLLFSYTKDYFDVVSLCLYITFSLIQHCHCRIFKG